MSNVRFVVAVSCVVAALVFGGAMSWAAEVPGSSGLGSNSTAEAVATGSEAERETDDMTEAWKAALEEALPLKPDEVRAYREAREAVDEAAKPREAPASMSSGAIPVSLEPGATSPRLTLLHGYVTGIEVLDSTGQPWPIVSVSQGDPTAVTVRMESVPLAANVNGPAPEGATVSVPAAVGQAGNVLTVSPASPYSATNVVIVLAGVSRPISVLLVAKAATADAAFQDRVTLLVDGRGPNARAESVRSFDHLDAGGELRNVLVGIPPTGTAAEILAELPPGMRAWRDGPILWIRASDRLISPSPRTSAAAGDVRAYQVPYMPVVVLSRGGKLEQVELVAKETERE